MASATFTPRSTPTAGAQVVVGRLGFLDAVVDDEADLPPAFTPGHGGRADGAAQAAGPPEPDLAEFRQVHLPPPPGQPNYPHVPPLGEPHRRLPPELAAPVHPSGAARRPG